MLLLGLVFLRLIYRLFRFELLSPALCVCLDQECMFLCRCQAPSYKYLHCAGSSRQRIPEKYMRGSSLLFITNPSYLCMQFVGFFVCILFAPSVYPPRILHRVRNPVRCGLASCAPVSLVCCSEVTGNAKDKIPLTSKQGT